MAQWSEEDFKRAAAETKLSQRTLAACKAVLVEGRTGKEVSQELVIVQPQISRGIRVLEEAAKSISQTAKVIEETQGALKAFAVKEARQKLGENVVIREAQPGEVYVGKPIVKLTGFLIQKVGRDAVLHDLGKLEVSPNASAHKLEISYPSDGRLASVSEKQPEQSRGGRGR